MRRRTWGALILAGIIILHVAYGSDTAGDITGQLLVLALLYYGFRWARRKVGVWRTRRGRARDPIRA